MRETKFRALGRDSDIVWVNLGMGIRDKVKGEIIYREGGFQFKSPIASQTFYLGDAEWFEVIGNIYENKELLDASN